MAGGLTLDGNLLIQLFWKRYWSNLPVTESAIASKPAPKAFASSLAFIDSPIKLERAPVKSVIIPVVLQAAAEEAFNAVLKVLSFYGSSKGGYCGFSAPGKYKIPVFPSEPELFGLSEDEGTKGIALGEVIGLVPPSSIPNYTPWAMALPRF